MSYCNKEIASLGLNQEEVDSLVELIHTKEDSLAEYRRLKEELLPKNLGKIATEFKNKLDETKDVISEAIKEVRGLSKVLNSEVILNLGFK